MPEIQLLDNDTIDKIAAGEVVERPVSVVKELIENSIDANATIITIEIIKGGIDKIRISDNGVGIKPSQVKKAFLRHSTSKIKTAIDLHNIRSLGFRGEALSSIAAVSRVELITKRADDMLGTLYVLEGSKEVKYEEIGAPNGTTIIVKDLFYNTLPRKKFLKSPTTEGNLIIDIVQKLALSHPDIAFQLSVDNKVRLSTVGSGKLKEAIYQIYGKNITDNLIKIDIKKNFFEIRGFIGNSSISRGNRAYENVFINDRYIKDKAITNAVEEGFFGYLMQHQYPFTCLMIDIDTSQVDVNVHPAKMEVRIDNINDLNNEIKQIIYDKLHNLEDIRQEDITEDIRGDINEDKINREETKKSDTEITYAHEDTHINKKINSNDSYIDDTVRIYEPYEENELSEVTKDIISKINNDIKEDNTEKQQISFLSREASVNHKIIGQLFNTYWLVEYDNSLYIIDQHAAHEKVLYEKTLSEAKDNQMSSQVIYPPVIVTLNAAEEAFLNDNIDVFKKIGYDIEHFGGCEYAINGIPYNIYGVDPAALFADMIAQCISNHINDSSIILDKIASMSCKAAVKGNDILSESEALELIDNLLKLDNPYHCPHGRPTIIKMSHYDIDKRFKRIQ